MQTIRARYEEFYVNATTAFLRDIGDSSAVGIPELHLPLWGRNYESTKLKIAFVGRDARNWGGKMGMLDFLQAAKRNINEAVFRSEIYFQDLPFVIEHGWTNN